MDRDRAIELEARYAAPIYDPLDLVVASAEGAWLTDADGRRYLDCLSAYSAANAGHGHPRILAALTEQAQRVAVTARALRNTVLPRMLERICTLAGQDMAIPMNTGAEAVETAIKVARRWGYRRKRIPDGLAEIVVCGGNFHGRTTTISGFSPVERYRAGFGPFAPGFRTIPFGDLDALAAAITPQTCAFLVEPIQGEGGVIIPPPGYLAAVRRLCSEQNVLLVADEVQTGLGRTGLRFECDREAVKPDLLVLGKALGGGLYPVSAVLASRDIMTTLSPGDHGSTFAGNPLAAAVALAALSVLEDEHLASRAASRGAQLIELLRSVCEPAGALVRGRGLLIGVEVPFPARLLADALLRHGIAAKNTHDHVLRVTPPLIISESEVEFIGSAFALAFEDLRRVGTATRTRVV